MKSRQRMRSHRARQPVAPAGRTKSWRGLTVLIIGCAAIAGAAFWVTQHLLGPGQPVVVSSNTVVIPPRNAATTNVLAMAGPSARTNLELSITDGTPPPIDTNDPVQLVNRGTEYLDRGLYDPAIDHYRKALIINPQDEEAHFNLGFAYAKKGETNSAVAEYEKAIELFPEYGEAHNNLGNIFVAQKRFEEAMKHFDEAVRINPENSSAHNNRGRCLAQLKRLPEAIKNFQEAVRLYTNYVEARFNLGMSYLQMGKPAEAIEQFQILRQQSPDFEPAMRGLQIATNIITNVLANPVTPLKPAGTASDPPLRP